MEKQLRENGEKLSEEDKTTVQTEIDAFKKVREGGNPDEIKTAMEAMTQKVYTIFGKLYQQAPGAEGTPNGGAAPEQNGANDDGTYDAEGDVH